MAKSKKSQSAKSTSYTILLLRLALGWLIFYAGITKLLEPGWTASGFLQQSTYGTFKEFFLGFAGNSLADLAVMWGLTLIGLSLIFGVLVRFASFLGIIMMILFYLPRFPPKTGLVEEHVIYSLVFLALMATGAGHISRMLQPIIFRVQAKNTMGQLYHST